MGNISSWLKKDGISFLRRVGIKEKDKIVDFGCGGGHYTIPAAQIVNRKGKVYALDKDKSALEQTRHLSEKFGLTNIELLNSYTKIPLEDNLADAALCYDVIHYERDRSQIYRQIFRVLKKDGLFSLYPKHYRDDFPLMELAEKSLEDIIREVEKAGFRLEQEIKAECFHDSYYNSCLVLNFKK